MIHISKLTVVSHAASTAEYICHNTNDATTTCEYFTGTNIVQIQPSETLLLLMLSLWNSKLKLTISKATITETMKQICADCSQINIANIKETLWFILSLIFACDQQ